MEDNHAIMNMGEDTCQETIFKFSVIILVIKDTIAHSRDSRSIDLQECKSRKFDQYRLHDCDLGNYLYGHFYDLQL